MEIRYWRCGRCGKELYDSEDFYTISKKYKQKHYNVNPYDMKKTYYAITDEEDVYHICVEYFSTLGKKHIYTKCFIVYLFNFC